MQPTPAPGSPQAALDRELRCLVNEGGEGEWLAGALPPRMLGCSLECQDIPRIMSGCSPQLTRQGERTWHLLCTQVWMPPAKAAPFPDFSANQPSRSNPHDAAMSPITPWVTLCAPACARQPGNWGPTSSALAVGRLHLDGAVHLQHKRERVVSAVPPESFPWGPAGFGQQLALGVREKGRDMQEQIRGSWPQQPGDAMCGGQCSSPGDGHPVLQAPAGLPVPGLAVCPLSSTAKDCRGSSSTPPAPAPLAPLPSFSQTSPKFGLLVTAVCTHERDTRVQQDMPGWQAHPWPAAPWSHFSSPLPLLFPLF